MGVIVATATALVLWIVMWAIGMKAFDAVLVAGTLVLLVATTRIALRHVPGLGGK